ncbi:uncharacterized protein MAM_02510 [Metarhizium album ARSEF 1941]|uniref:Tachykinin family protein n=1 Tax=Metarhizium album (strain ARSEF 1941) TaxID=1081103 RepID=A0A0B2X1T2_METAS|nr:uncharacterized protein MAM_02510 [Metarhizium album ARSEF 1941]KHN99657.1 hypothetical protein MAM_02510 [Metarhizium album ARSEF 1941]
MEFEFVIGSQPQELKVDTSRKLRSYLSKRAWREHRARYEQSRSTSESSPLNTSSSVSQSEAQHSSRGGTVDGDANLATQAAATKANRRRRHKLQTVTFECIATGPIAPPPPALTWATIQDITGVRELDDCPEDRLLQLFAQSLARSPPMDTHFGGGRVDPFRSYPGPWQPYIPALADHYIVQMARDIPELDQPGNRGLLRSRWFPLVLSDNAPFQVVMLLAAANYASVNNISTLGCHILRMKQDAITVIHNTFKDERKLASDCLIGAVAKMASFEAMHGDVLSYQTHMAGLVRMLELRGGLDALGLGGLLRRIIVWIDLNSAFLLNVPRYFPGTTFTGVEEKEVTEVVEPNPERFIAV